MCVCVCVCLIAFLLAGDWEIRSHTKQTDNNNDIKQNWKVAQAAADAAKWNREVCKVAGRRVGAAAEEREASLTIAAAVTSTATATATATSTTVAAAIFDVCFDFRQRDKIFFTRCRSSLSCSSEERSVEKGAEKERRRKNR